MAPIRIPTEQDFDSLSPFLTLSVHFPSPPESTTSFLLLFHGLGDDHPAFKTFASSLSLPGVLAISIRGISPLPPALLGLDDTSAPPTHFHWGRDLTLDPDTGDLDPDPGFEKAERAVMDKLIKELLREKCGWRADDMLLFGYGQGGSLALGLASEVRLGLERVVDVTDGERYVETAFKGVVSVGGPLPMSMVPSISGRQKAKTPALVLCGRDSKVVDEEAVDTMEDEFEDVKVVRWKRAEDGMPRNREEVLPLMEFFADRLRSPAPFSIPLRNKSS